VAGLACTRVSTVTVLVGAWVMPVEPGKEPLMSKDNEDLVRRVEEAWDANDLDALDELFAPEFFSHAALPGMPPGLAGAKMAHHASMSAFPDRKMTIDDLFAAGDRVAVRTTVRGTNQGGLAWIGVPPNGRPVEVESISIYRVAEGKIAEHWGQNDVMRLMQQLGAMPSA
jgi:predicted ester cyclase